MSAALVGATGGCKQDSLWGKVIFFHEASHSLGLDISFYRFGEYLFQSGYFPCVTN